MGRGVHTPPVPRAARGASQREKMSGLARPVDVAAVAQRLAAPAAHGIGLGIGSAADHPASGCGTTGGAGLQPLVTAGSFDRCEYCLGFENSFPVPAPGTRYTARGTRKVTAIRPAKAGNGSITRHRMSTRDGADQPTHHATLENAGMAMRFSPASRVRPSIRHFGMDPDDFQLDTVVGGRSSAVATAIVPPSASMNCSTVCMTDLLRVS